MNKKVIRISYGMLEKMNGEIIKNISIIGAGSWGTTVARVIAENHQDVTVMLWAYEKAVVNSINEYRENRPFLPGISLPPNIRATANLKECLRNSSIVILATPSKVLYETCVKMRKLVTNDSHIAFVSKGFCRVHNNIHTISETIAEALPQLKNHIVAISGPSHAEEVSQGFHTCLSVGGTSEISREIFVRLLSCGYIQCRETDDTYGVELGGTLKNPAAIASGLISALPRCGDNLSGALIAESMKEILRIGKSFGAREDTLLDVCGLGDLITTAMSEHSRNRRFGRDIARKILDKGKSLGFYDRILLRFNPDYVLGRMSEKMHYLAEGAYAIEPLIELSAQKKISIPVYRSLYEVLLNKKNPSLLIETIKNPERFEDIFARTKINIINKKKGMEHASAYYFRKLIISSIYEKYLKDEYFKKDILSFGESAIEEGRMRTRDSKGTHERTLNIKEIRLYRRMRQENPENAVKSLAGLYFEDISDRYTYLVYNVLLRALRLFSRLNIFGVGGIRRWFEQNIEAAGNVKDIRKTVTNVTPVYYAENLEGYDVALIGMAISKAGLPSPRYIVNKEVLSGNLMKMVIKRTGGYCVDRGRMKNPLYLETLMRYLSETVAHGIPVLYFTGSGDGRDAGPGGNDSGFIAMLIDTLVRTTEEIAVIPVSISKDREHPPSTSGKLRRFSSFDVFTTRARVYFALPLMVSEFMQENDTVQVLGEAVKSRWRSLL